MVNNLNVIYCNNGIGYSSPLRHHRIINTWSILTNEVSKLLWFNFLLHAVFTFEQWLIVLILKAYKTNCVTFFEVFSICVLMYLYYIYLLISAMMDLLSDEIPLKFYYERLRRRILSKVGDRFAYGMGCWMWLARKRSARWTLWPCTRTMMSSGFTRSTCLLNCLMPKLTKVH